MPTYVSTLASLSIYSKPSYNWLYLHVNYLSEISKTVNVSSYQMYLSNAYGQNVNDVIMFHVYPRYNYVLSLDLYHTF